MHSVVLTSVSTTGGYLEHANVAFSPNLNCIIGERGTCKSTLVESIRYAVDTDTERAIVLRGQRPSDRTNTLYGLIGETLGQGTVRCSVGVSYDGNESMFSIERDATSDSRVYQDGVREHIDHDLLHGFDIYSQHDLQELAKHPEQRLRLIDKPIAKAVAAKQREWNQVSTRLHGVAVRIRDNRKQIDALSANASHLPELQSQLNSLQESRPSRSDELDKARTKFQKRQAEIAALGSVVEIRSAVVGQLSSLGSRQSELKDIIDRYFAAADPSSPWIRASQRLLDRINTALLAAEEIQALDFDESRQAHVQSGDADDQIYFSLQKSQEDVNESIKKEDLLLRQIAHLESVQENARKLVAQNAQLQEERIGLRKELTQISSQLYEMRESQVAAINDAHSDLIILSLTPGPQSDAYVEHLSSLLAGSRIREQREVAKDLSRRFSPAELVDFVENGDAMDLARDLDRDLGQMTRVLNHLADHEKLYDIETTLIDDSLGVTLFDKGVPKPIETLSNGQKATALLPLILRDADYPLIVDQPEDDLDNSFIFRSLVNTIRSLKTRRQLIFVTHNANIPVLGEAERVIVMTMQNPKSAAIPLCGAVDERKPEILDLLEGGAEAFEERQKRYGDLVHASRQ